MVSKTWMSAALDLVFPCPAVIDLTVLDSPELASRPYLAKIYTVFIKRRLDTLPPDSFSTLLQGNTFLLPHKLQHIARRTPSMQELIIPRTLAMHHIDILPAIKQWKRLKKLQCPAPMVPLRDIKDSIKAVEALHLFWPVDDWVAEGIRDGLPRLRQLRIDSCALSANALSIILDGHGDLELLDTRHSYRVPRGRDNRSWFWLHDKFLEWNEDEIRVKAARVKVHLQCARKRCSECDVPYRDLLAKRPKNWKPYARAPTV